MFNERQQQKLCESSILEQKKEVNFFS